MMEYTVTQAISYGKKKDDLENKNIVITFDDTIIKLGEVECLYKYSLNTGETISKEPEDKSTSESRTDPERKIDVLITDFPSQKENIVDQEFLLAEKRREAEEKEAKKKIRIENIEKEIDILENEMRKVGDSNNGIEGKIIENRNAENQNEIMNLRKEIERINSDVDYKDSVVQDGDNKKEIEDIKKEIEIIRNEIEIKDEMDENKNQGNKEDLDKKDDDNVNDLFGNRNGLMNNHDEEKKEEIANNEDENNEIENLKKEILELRKDLQEDNGNNENEIDNKKREDQNDLDSIKKELDDLKRQIMLKKEKMDNEQMINNNMYKKYNDNMEENHQSNQEQVIQRERNNEAGIEQNMG